jgi:hypothetical protein
MSLISVACQNQDKCGYFPPGWNQSW